MPQSEGPISHNGSQAPPEGAHSDAVPQAWAAAAAVGAEAPPRPRSASTESMQIDGLATECGLARVHGQGSPTKRRRAMVRLEAAKPPQGFLPWARGYSRADLVGDAVAGVTVAVVLVPQGIAYAMLAELPPVYGLYTAAVPLMVFGVTTNSRHACVGPFALMSLIVAELMESVVPGSVSADSHEYVNGVLALTLVIGAMQVLAGLVGLGLVSSFLADPSVAGLTSASALIIASSQLKHVLGVHLPRGSLLRTLAQAAQVVAAGDVNMWAVATTTFALALMSALKALNHRFCAKVPLFEQLIAVVVCTALSAALDAPLPTVGEVPSGLPRPKLPQPPRSLEALSALVEAGATGAFMSYLLTMSIVRFFATKHKYAIDANRELMALGACNLVGALFQAYPSSGSLSRSALASSVGSRTPLHGVVQGACICLVLVGFTPLFRRLPYATLAAIVFAALQKLVDLSVAGRLWRTSRNDFWLWAVAFGGTVVFGVQVGMLLCLAASLAVLVFQTSRPRHALLGRLPGTDLFRDVDCYPGAERQPGVVIFRFDAPLLFANCEHFTTAVSCAIGEEERRGTPATHVILDCSSMHAIDASAAAALRQLIASCRAEKRAVILACTREPFREALSRHGLFDEIGDNNMYLTILHAVERGCTQLRPSPDPKEEDTSPVTGEWRDLPLTRSRGRRRLPGPVAGDLARIRPASSASARAGRRSRNGAGSGTVEEAFSLCQSGGEPSSAAAAV